MEYTSVLHINIILNLSATINHQGAKASKVRSHCVLTAVARQFTG